MATEKRLIDANSYDAILKNREETLITYSGSLSGAIKGCRALLDEQPTVDAVEVVRCKDCKHGMKSHLQPRHSKNYLCRHSWEGEYHEPDHFCSYGEK